MKWWCWTICAIAAWSPCSGCGKSAVQRRSSCRVIYGIEQCLDRIFQTHTIIAVLHFAGLKAVGESVEKPLEYYDNNVAGSLILLAAMHRAGVRNLVFSSSATVYGDPVTVPIREDFALGPTNPYGRTKHMVEDILADWQRCESRLEHRPPALFQPGGRAPQRPYRGGIRRVLPTT